MAEIRKLQRSQLDFNNVMEIAQDAIMSRLNCHNIGRILEFDKDTQTCMVELMQIKQFNNQLITPAPITQVPLIILGSGGGHITMPNPVGTICLLLFLDRNMDNFMETGEQYVPDTTRMHDWTDCVAITTFTTLANPITNYDENAITINHHNETENEENNSYIKVYPNEIKMDVQTDNGVTLETKITANDKITLEGSGGAVIKASDKILLKNSTQDFLTLLNELITDFILPLYPTDPKKSQLQQLQANFALLFETLV